MAEDEQRERKAKKRGGRVAKLTSSERKRRKREYNKKLATSRIYIGGAIDKWKSLQLQTKVQTDEELAKMLLERFEREATFKEPQRVHTKTSTPATSSIIARLKVKEYDRTPSMSEISAESEQEPMSGVEELQVSGQEDPGELFSGIEELQGSGAEDTLGIKSDQLEKQVSCRLRKPVPLSTSFCDPFNLSIDISMPEEEVDVDDPDYQPSFDITAILPDDVTNDAEDVAFEEAEFGFEVPGNDGFLEGPDIEMATSVGIHKISTDDECRDLTGAIKCIAFVEQIRDLLSINISQCKEQSCQKPIGIVESFVGSAMYLKWVCDEDHVSHQWCSQPQLNRRLHSGDFLICGSILSSGNNYSKMALWAEMLSLKFPSADQFHRICSTYIIPSINKYWNDHKRDLLQDLKDKDVVVLGDGRNDSPGHSAQYCSYTLMDNDTKKSSLFTH